MAVRIASATIYARFPDHTRRSRTISPGAVSSTVNACRRVLDGMKQQFRPEPRVSLLASGIRLVSRDSFAMPAKFPAPKSTCEVPALAQDLACIQC
jgi:hypothetical protein